MLDYRAASNETIEIVRFLILTTISPLAFLIGWRFIVYYFNSFFEDHEEVDVDVDVQ